MLNDISRLIFLKNFIDKWKKKEMVIMENSK